MKRLVSLCMQSKQTTVVMIRNNTLQHIRVLCGQHSSRFIAGTCRFMQISFKLRVKSTSFSKYHGQTKQATACCCIQFSALVSSLFTVQCSRLYIHAVLFAYTASVVWIVRVHESDRYLLNSDTVYCNIIFSSHIESTTFVKSLYKVN